MVVNSFHEHDIQKGKWNCQLLTLWKTGGQRSDVSLTGDIKGQFRSDEEYPRGLIGRFV